MLLVCHCDLPFGRVIAYVNGTASEAGAAAEVAASRKQAKYADIDSRHVFEPIAVETLGVFNSSARLLLNEIAKKISFNTGDSRETSFLFQRTCLGIGATFQCQTEHRIYVFSICNF